MNHTIKLKVLTQEKTVFAEDVAEVVVPTESGEITILPNHSPLISIVKTGEIKIRHKDEKTLTPVAVSSGVIEIRPRDFKNNKPTEVIVLSARSERVTDIDLYRAEEAYSRAKKVMELQSETKDTEIFEQNQEMIEKELNRIRVYKKYRG